MAQPFKIEALDQIHSDLPESVGTARPQFESTTEALQYYAQKLETIAKQKNLSLDELRVHANLYKFGPEESFQILGLFDSVRALKASE